MVAAWFVLVGGESAGSHGGDFEGRQFQHTSVPFIGQAYESLRGAGVPRERIITIVQLEDYLDHLQEGVLGKLCIPARFFEEQRDRTLSSCRRLIDEGGADYDGVHVNPTTVMQVLNGQTSIPATRYSGRAPPRESDEPIFFAIYSHGNNYMTVGEDQKHPLQNEWYIHFPYPSPDEESIAFVAYHPTSTNELMLEASNKEQHV